MQIQKQTPAIHAPCSSLCGGLTVYDSRGTELSRAHQGMIAISAAVTRYCGVIQSWGPAAGSVTIASEFNVIEIKYKHSRRAARHFMRVKSGTALGCTNLTEDRQTDGIATANTRT